MINVLLEPAPESDESLVSVCIPNEDTGIALEAIWYAQIVALERRETAVGMPTTYYGSENPKANPLSDLEWRYENIADRLFSDQGDVPTHTISDTYRELDATSPGGVRVHYDPWRLGTACLQAIRTGVQLAHEDEYPPVIGARLTKIRYIGKALGALFNVANREAARLEKIQRDTTAYLDSIMTVQVVTPQEAANIRDVRTYEEERYRQEATALVRAQREAEWPGERKLIRQQIVRQHLSDSAYVAMLREMVVARRAARTGQ